MGCDTMLFTGQRRVEIGMPVAEGRQRKTFVALRPRDAARPLSRPRCGALSNEARHAIRVARSYT
jgi:hypothetical protein